MTGLGVLAVAIWTALIASGFWTTRENDDAAGFAVPTVWPDVVAVVPARDEADVIARSLGSLIAQDYPGVIRIVLVDDNSSDGTGRIARGMRERVFHCDPPSEGEDLGPLAIIDGAPLPAGWTGKLWALHQGIAAAGADGDGAGYFKEGGAAFKKC